MKTFRFTIPELGPSAAEKLNRELYLAEHNRAQPPRPSLFLSMAAIFLLLGTAGLMNDIAEQDLRPSTVFFLLFALERFGAFSRARRISSQMKAET
ncbi:hypothetical protein [Cerasicoccus frondis]|uniref:hypothetical protein n=1 Tax=Cerasicoccus frondis TaxID=490090 RepID=UPI0028527BA5|nr:hypothetical protein [Cerasicoccus frondis]